MGSEEYVSSCGIREVQRVRGFRTIGGVPRDKRGLEGKTWSRGMGDVSSYKDDPAL